MNDNIVVLPTQIDKLSVIYGLIVYGKRRITFLADRTFYLARMSANDEAEPDKTVTLGWLQEEELRVLKDAGLVVEDDIVKKKV
jgi:hypothetical protein